jgi:hypothetical protein
VAARLRTAALPWLAAACLATCATAPEEDRDDDDSADDDDADAGVVGLGCEPETIGEVIVVEWEESTTVQMQAFAILSDGSRMDVVEDTWWSILDQFGGIITNAGLFTTPSTHGGRAPIEVQWEGRSARCSVDLRLHIEINAGIDTDLAALDAASAATPARDDSCAAELLYPATEAVFPPNSLPPLFQWTHPASTDLYVLRLSTEFAEVEVVTRGVSWQSQFGIFGPISASHGGQAVSVNVELLAGLWNPATESFVEGLCTAASTPTLGLSRVRLVGSVYYWSPAAQGLLRIRIGSDQAEPWMTADQTGQCVGCHASNPENPQLITMVYEGGNGWAVAADVSTPESPVMPTGSRRGNFLAPNPDGTRLVRSFHGVLYLDDLMNNTEIGIVPTTGYSTHVNWSPDGTRLVYSSCASAVQDWVVTGCGLRTIEVGPGDAFGADTQLLAADPSWNYYYPSFSPGNDWIAFNRSTEDAYDDPDAQVMIMPAAGGTPIRLDRANLDGSRSNSWPRWAVQDGDIAWMAFASRRAYGRVVDGKAQVWLAEVDLARAAQGLDPSAPAIWLPGQDTTTGNHTPVWVPRNSGN